MTPDEPLTLQKVLTDIMSAEVAIDPWKATIGLVALRTSEYVQRGQVYALDPSRAGVGDVSQSALVHPDDVAAIKATMRDGLRMRRDPTDDELAAWLYWVVHQERQKEPR